MAVLGTFTSGAVLTAAELNQLNNCTILTGLNAQVIASGVITGITFGAGTETLDVSNWHSTTANTSRITPNIAGYYLAIMRVTFNRVGAAIRFAGFIGKNGGFGDAENGFLGGNYPTPTCSVMLYMNGTTDYLESFCYQETGANVNLLRQEFSVMLLRKA